MRPTSLHRIALLGLGLGLGASCTSRTLPLPPPEVDMVAAPNVQGLVLVRGMAQEGASIGVVNDATGTGVVVTTESGCSRSCPFEAWVEAEPGDSLRVWQFFRTSSGRDVMVPEPE
jgi:hypothetical protein